MNDRIKQLARQCNAYSKDDDGQETKIAILIGKEVEKFAEKIVRECMTIAQEYDGAKLGGPGLIIAMRIEQHFGVNE